VVGVPKTIDNDIGCTDVTFGFDTALCTATEAIDKLHTTAESDHRVMIVEVMGRNAGWLALRSGLAGGGDVILIPEIPFSLQAIVQKIAGRRAQGRLFSIIVVAEGAQPLGGQQVYQPAATSVEQSRLGGIGQWLADAMRGLCDYEIRVVVLGYIQRGGSPSPFDRILATRFGAAAVRTVAEGQLDVMVALRSTEIITVPLGEAIAQVRVVPLTSDLILTAQGLGICLGA